MRRGEAHRGLVAVLLLAVALPGCERLAKLRAPKPATPSKPTATAGALLPRPLTGEAVRRLVFGNGSGDEAGARAIAAWRPRKLWQGPEKPEFDEKTEFDCRADALLPFREGDALRAFVMTSVRPEDHVCHVCEPLLGAMALTETADGWRIDAVEPELLVLGSQGEAPGYDVVGIGPGRSGVLVTVSSSNMGITSTGIGLFAEKRGGGFAEILPIVESASDNAGDCDAEAGKPCWEFDSEWKFVEEKGRELSDFILTRKGTKASDTAGEVTEFSETLLYRFDGTKYAPVK